MKFSIFWVFFITIAETSLLDWDQRLVATHHRSNLATSNLSFSPPDVAEKCSDVRTFVSDREGTLSCQEKTSTLSKRKGGAPQPSITFSCQAGGGVPVVGGGVLRDNDNDNDDTYMTPWGRFDLRPKNELTRPESIIVPRNGNSYPKQKLTQYLFPPRGWRASVVLQSDPRQSTNSYNISFPCQPALEQSSCVELQKARKSFLLESCLQQKNIHNPVFFNQQLQHESKTKYPPSFVFLSWGGVFFGLSGRLNGEADDPLDGLACSYKDTERQFPEFQGLCSKIPVQELNKPLEMAVTSTMWTGSSSGFLLFSSVVFSLSTPASPSNLARPVSSSSSSEDSAWVISAHLSPRERLKSKLLFAACVSDESES